MTISTNGWIGAVVGGALGALGAHLLAGKAGASLVEMAVGAGAGAVAGGFVGNQMPAATAALAPATAASFNAANAIQVSLQPSSYATTVAKGSSVQAMNSANALWQSPGVSSTDATILAPSNPATTSGFVAVGTGTATLTGTYADPNTQAAVPVAATITVT
jgi:hypothetical protein